MGPLLSPSSSGAVVVAACCLARRCSCFLPGDIGPVPRRVGPAAAGRRQRCRTQQHFRNPTSPAAAAAAATTAATAPAPPRTAARATIASVRRDSRLCDHQNSAGRGANFYLHLAVLCPRGIIRKFWEAGGLEVTVVFHVAN